MFNRPSKAPDSEAETIRREGEEAVIRLSAEQPARLAEFQQWLARDKSLYRFRCERHGDFLAVFITRGPEPEPEYRRWLATNKTVAAVKIGRGGIRLTEGDDPARDQSSALRFEFTDGKRQIVLYVRPYESRGMMLTGPSDGRNNAYISSSDCRYAGQEHLAGLIVNEVARPASDDKIYFTDADMTLWIPHGLGGEVYAQIMAACAKTEENSRLG